MLSYTRTLMVLAFATACGGSAQDDTLFTSSSGGFPAHETGGAAGQPALETGGFPQEGGRASVATGGAPAATGGKAAATGGSVSTGGIPSTGGSLQTGGTPAAGGQQPSGGAPGTGGSLQTTGGVSPGTGGIAATGGSASVGNPQCEPYAPGTDYAIGDVAQLGSAYYLCTGPACADKSPQDDSVYAWRKTSCGATCGCSIACNAPIVGFVKTSHGNEPFTAYPEYLAAIRTGWMVRVQRADSCTDTGQCLYVESYSLMRCIGTDQECRDRDPRYENCNGILGAHFPCVQLGTPSPWEVLTTACP